MLLLIAAFSLSAGIHQGKDASAFRVSPSIMQKYPQLILSFIGRREGGSSLQAVQIHHGMRNTISSGITACRLKYSGHSSVLVVYPAQDRNRDDSFSKLIWYNGGDCPFRNLLVYSLVWSRPIEILNVSKQDTVQLLLTCEQMTQVASTMVEPAVSSERETAA
jgi:hypothetical protein